MGTTRQISEFIANLTLSDVPQKAIQSAKGALLDAIGVAIAGTQTEAARIMIAWARETGGSPSAGVIGSGFKTSPSTAARVNGTIAHALDYDPPLPLLSVLLALSETTHASGREVLEAYIAGFEVQSRLQGGVTPQHSAHGWHSNAVFGTMSATAAAARLLELDADQIVMAFGIASSEASGIRQNLGTMAKSHHAGHAAANGVIAAMLAGLGYTGAPDSFEGEYGFLNVFATPHEFDEQKITGLLGSVWTLEKGVRIKPYPCCRMAHRALDALLALVRRCDFGVSDVEAIECEVSAHVTRVMTYEAADSELEAKFCLPYCLAVAVSDRSAGLHQFSDERVRDPAVQALATRVRVSHPHGKSEWDRKTLLPCAVRVRLKDGRVIEELAGAARGDADNPLSFADIIQKYRSCTDTLLSTEKQERLLSLLANVEELDNLSELEGILTSDVQPTALAARR